MTCASFLWEEETLKQNYSIANSWLYLFTNHYLQLWIPKGFENPNFFPIILVQTYLVEIQGLNWNETISGLYPI